MDIEKMVQASNVENGAIKSAIAAAKRKKEEQQGEQLLILMGQHEDRLKRAVSCLRQARKMEKQAVEALKKIAKSKEDFEKGGDIHPFIYAAVGRDHYAYSVWCERLGIEVSDVSKF